MTAAATVCIRVCHGDPLVMAGLVSLIGREPGFHVHAGLAKLYASSRLQVAVRAIRRGLLRR